jgi:hypothetical protein
MANYTIIGGDGRQYGPISGNDLRKWISEGRLNAQSLAKEESDTEFRALSAFPEFADVFGAGEQISGAPPPLSPSGSGSRETALQRVKAPAVALKVTAILNLVLATWSLIQTVFFQPSLQQFMQNSWLNELFKLLGVNISQFQEIMQKSYNMTYGPVGVVSDLFQFILPALVLIGATKMQSLRSYEFAYTAAILAMIPCLTPCCLPGLPFGIWALIVLKKPEVKSHFS